MHALEPAVRRATANDVLEIVALQHAAYAQNRAILGVEPLPLQADYQEILARMECWIAGDGDAVDGLLVLELREDDLLIWSIATHPRARSVGVGRGLLAFAEKRAGELGRAVLRLYTGEILTANIAWYTRHGYTVEWIEQMPDRRAVHMKKIRGEHG